VSDLYIPRIGPYFLAAAKKSILEIYKSLTDMSVGIGRHYYDSVLEIMRMHSYISGNT
jgi:hypothetical protein